mmetsp:Transcript_17647/g.44594  ORF Transcript_17647/g.44594 Transcript_17647/m.44594 type:complete len:128 (-) Transcript_17647:262-645(-)|eukprot:CAMPEP_0173440960 /NCGR_PEP_ID=MMETSP1357-20121228/23702_1 /TAXON_ID=77926 /ORGANISM="Hemiselmis rufescens, Strain PCC563" /LENGTH=127 /DNA_ID=CAMNT_0014406503 /DNA_START=19 /DNA_END=402 /DNA_ORIENTATION=-
MSSEQHKASEEGLERYFKAVRASLPKEEKLQGIAACFAEGSELISPNGSVFKGPDGAKHFYASPTSPVLGEGFAPKPDRETQAWSADGRTTAVEIALTLPDKAIPVGDWFTFDGEGQITRLRIYSGA